MCESSWARADTGRCAGQHASVAERVWRDFPLKDLYQSAKGFELTFRAMGFAALAMLTVIPLLVVVAAASAVEHHGVAVWVVYGMGLTRASARAVVRLFSAPALVLGTTSVFSAVLLGLFGVMFGGSVQAAFERVWGLPAGPWHKIWRQAVWLVALIAYVYAAATVGALTTSAPAETVSRVSVALVLGIVFFWWGLRFLLGGRVSYLAALPGAVATVAFLAGLRAFSTLVFEPLIATNAVTYGAVGTVLILQSWLIGVGWVIYGGQLFGRWFYDGWLRVRADSHRVPGEPGGEGSPMSESESAGLAEAASLEVYAAVAQAMRQAGARDSRLGADAVIGAVRRAIAAWVLAADGDETALAAVAEPEAAHFLVHPSGGRWQVAPGPAVTLIQIWGFEPDAEPPRVQVSWRFTGRRRFIDPGPNATAEGENTFVGLLDLTLTGSGPWQLWSGHVDTLDGYLGYAFTSRRETADEYRKRTGSAAVPAPAGPPRVFRLTSGFAEHDERLGSTASVDVLRETAPTRDEAEKLIQPAIWDATVQALGDGDWRPSMNWLDVIELLGE